MHSISGTLAVFLNMGRGAFDLEGPEPDAYALLKKFWAGLLDAPSRFLTLTLRCPPSGRLLAPGPAAVCARGAGDGTNLHVVRSTSETRVGRGAPFWIGGGRDQMAVRN